MSQNSKDPSHGLTVFVAATFALGVAMIAALDRVGAPDRLVRGMGPILALFSLVIIGLGARNADLASFMTARRAIPPFYGALGLPVVLAGIELCLDPNLAAPLDPTLLAVVAGVGLGAIGYAPLLRRFGATWANDVVATRFSGSPLPIISGVASFATAALTALAGYRMAVAAVAPLAAPNRLWAEVIVAAVLFLSIAPGGLTGLIWCAAASAGEIAAIIIFAIVAGWLHGPAPADSVIAVGPASFALAFPSLASSAVTLAAAGFIAFQPQAIASRNAWSAVKAGFAGWVLCAALAAVVAPLFSFSIDLRGLASNPVAASLIGAFELVSALALARVGAHASSRAFGVALANPTRPFPAPASVRLARMRGVQLAVVIGCALCDGRDVLDARTALVIAMALTLVLATPLVALAAIRRVGPVSASIGMFAALAVIAFRLTPMTRLPSAAETFEDALMAAAAAFIAGALTSLIAPRRDLAPTPKEFDPYGSQGEARSSRRASS